MLAVVPEPSPDPEAPSPRRGWRAVRRVPDPPRSAEPTRRTTGASAPARRARDGRRVTGSPADAPAAPTGHPAAEATPPTPVADVTRPAGAGSRRRHADAAAEQGLRALVTSRPTQLSPTLAMRAREMASPTAEDLAAAAESVVLVRRNYLPAEPLTMPRRARRTPGRREQRGKRRSGDPDAAGRRQDGNAGGAESVS